MQKNLLIHRCDKEKKNAIVKYFQMKIAFVVHSFLLGIFK